MSRFKIKIFSAQFVITIDNILHITTGKNYHKTVIAEDNT
jgi:hypothetical protein